MSRQLFTSRAEEAVSLEFRVDFEGESIRFVEKGATGFDGISEAVAACPGRRAPGKTLGKTPTANNNFALAA